MQAGGTEFDDAPLTAEDMMATSALAVSPILTASFFDQLYNNSNENSNITEQSINDNPMIYRHRLHRFRRLPPPTATVLPPPPPPSARWTERLSSLQSALDQISAIDDQEITNEDDIRPVSLPSIELFPRSATGRYVYGQNCHNGKAYNTSPLLSASENLDNAMLDFDVTSDDGGQYG
jgi:hypothetical protein